MSPPVSSPILSGDPSDGMSVGSIAVNGHTVDAEEKAVRIYDDMQKHSDVDEFFVLNADKKPCGIVTRNQIMSVFGGMYGYNLHLRSKASDIMEKHFLSVDFSTSITDTAQLAMNREHSQVYEAAAVTKNGRYIGQVTVRDLLLAFIEIKVNAASDVNPLTRLPGNRAIQERIRRLITAPGHNAVNSSKAADAASDWSIIYIDLDNFKAFNDAYGFTIGDKVLLSAADSMKVSFPESTFIGHIGGDDFTIIAPFSDPEEVRGCCKAMCDAIRERILPLYTEEDRSRGYIISHDRLGFIRQFSIITMSIAVMTAQHLSSMNMDDFSGRIAAAKKKAKQQDGDAIIFAAETES
ncbi:MAG: GGDEF domain-containing protein [Eubacterium sp.]|nr:GGDEF domain-containing protein [Eubacterium sp.]